MFLAMHHLDAAQLKLTRPMLKGAAAVEAIHEGTLIHDDIIDGSLARRGQSSVGAEFTICCASNLGAFFFGRGVETLAAVCGPYFDEADTLSLIQRLAKGQILESLPPAADFATQKARSLNIIDGKTGSLFEFSCLMGLAANENPTHLLTRYRGTMTKFAGALGRAYQIRDDILDIENADSLKRPGSQDVHRGMLSWPAMLWAGESPDWGRALQEYSQGGKDRKATAEIRRRILRSNALRLTRKDMKAYLREAQYQLDILPVSYGRATLQELLDWLGV